MYYVMKHKQNILFLNNLFGKKYSIGNMIRILISIIICRFVLYIWIEDIFGKGTKVIFFRF